MNGSVLPGSAEALEVVLGVVLLVALVDGAVLAPLADGVELGPDALAVGLPVEPPVELPVELLFELGGDGLCDGLDGWLEGFVHVANGSTYCWLPADGEHPLWASAAELIVSPSAREARKMMKIRNKRVTAAIQAMLKNERDLAAWDPLKPPL